MYGRSDDAWLYRTKSYKPKITKDHNENVARAFHEIRVHIDPEIHGPHDGGPCYNPLHVLETLKEWGVLDG